MCWGDRIRICRPLYWSGVVGWSEIVNVVVVMHCNLMHVEIDDGFGMLHDRFLHHVLACLTPFSELSLEGLEMILRFVVAQRKCGGAIIHREFESDLF